jgi:protoporphyrinogen oxidase
MNTSPESWLVIGGGFQGIIGAYLLALNGKKVTLIERSSRLGGVLDSIKWNDFYLDKGCHLFDNSSDITTKVMREILKDDIEPVSVTYASVVNSIKTDGIAIPDLANFGDKVVKDILYELIKAFTQPEAKPETLTDKLKLRFGETASNLLVKAAEKMYQTDVSQLEETSFALTPFQRIKFLDNSLATILKTSSVLDERVAASSQLDPMKYYRDRASSYPYRNFYPKTQGLRGFCQKAQETLTEAGVSIILGKAITELKLSSSSGTTILEDSQEITGDKILWTLGVEAFEKIFMNDNKVARYVHHVPMILYYFIIDKNIEGEYTYLQNFDMSDLFFRASVPGKYGYDNCPSELSYVCCEVPTTLDSPEWHNPEHFTERIWQEIQKFQVVQPGGFLETFITKTPTSYKLPKVGYSQVVNELIQSLNDMYPVKGLEQSNFAKNDIILYIKKLLDNQ